MSVTLLSVTLMSYEEEDTCHMRRRIHVSDSSFSDPYVSDSCMLFHILRDWQADRHTDTQTQAYGAPHSLVRIACSRIHCTPDSRVSDSVRFSLSRFRVSAETPNPKL
jgi:hypothetical protein